MGTCAQSHTAHTKTQPIVEPPPAKGSSPLRRDDVPGMPGNNGGRHRRSYARDGRISSGSTGLPVGHGQGSSMAPGGELSKAGHRLHACVDTPPALLAC